MTSTNKPLNLDEKADEEGNSEMEPPPHLERSRRREHRRSRSRSSRRTSRESSGEGRTSRSGSRSNRRARRGRRHSRSRRESSRSDSSISTASSRSANTDISNSDSETDTRTAKQRPKRSLYRVLRKHEAILRKLAKDQDQDLGRLVNSLGKTQLKEATHQPNQLRAGKPIKVPKLSKTDARTSTLKEAVLTLKESFRTQLSGSENQTILDLVKSASVIAENSRLSKRQFLTLLKSRSVQDSTLGKFLRNAINRDTDIKTFLENVNVFFCPEESYLKALGTYNSFSGKGLSAVEFISSLRDVCEQLINLQQPSQKGALDDALILGKMREKFFQLFPTLAENVVNFEKIVGQPKTSAQFGRILNNFAQNIESVLTASSSRGSGNPRRVHGIFDRNESGNDEEQINLLKSGSGPRTLKLSYSDLNRLQDTCYKCGGQSPIQPEEHRSSTCMLYQGTALASYLCGECKIGVHLRADCLQCPEKKDALIKRAAELDMPLKIEEHIHVVLLDDQKN